MWVWIQIPTYVCIHKTHTHTPTHARTHAHTHTHTHTHTHIPCSIASLVGCFPCSTNAGCTSCGGSLLLMVSIFWRWIRTSSKLSHISNNQHIRIHLHILAHILIQGFNNNIIIIIQHNISELDFPLQAIIYVYRAWNDIHQSYIIINV